MKNSKGITLIALVITIIVLLILAGVTLSLVIGENGILGKATGAVTEQTKAEIKEAIVLSVNACDVYWGAMLPQNANFKRIDAYNDSKYGIVAEMKNLGYEVTGVEVGPSQKTWTVTKDGNTYEVPVILTEEGNLTFEGEYKD